MIRNYRVENKHFRLWDQGLFLFFHDFDSCSTWHGDGQVAGIIRHHRLSPTKNPLGIIRGAIHTSARGRFAIIIVPVS